MWWNRECHRYHRRARRQEIWVLGNIPTHTQMMWTCQNCNGVICKLHARESERKPACSQPRAGGVRHCGWLQQDAPLRYHTTENVSIQYRRQMKNWNVLREPASEREEKIAPNIRVKSPLNLRRRRFQKDGCDYLHNGVRRASNTKHGQLLACRRNLT